MADGIVLGVLVAIVLSVTVHVLWIGLSESVMPWYVGMAVTIVSVLAGIAYGIHRTRGKGSRDL